jgi:hypothetical protein
VTKSRGIIAPRRAWTEFELAVMRMHYAKTLTADLAELFSRPADHVYAKARNMGLSKAQEFQATASSGRILRGGRLSVDTQFKPGMTPANKGKKMPAGWAPGDMAKTQFKPGSKPVTWRPVGTCVVNGDGYLDRKVADGTGPRHHFWKPVHRLVWIEANGEIPAGHVVVFKPGQFTNVLEEITLDRVECITRRDLMLRNTFHNLPPQLREIVHLRSAITRQINQQTKEESDEQEH